MKRTTAISDESSEPIRIRGYSLPELIERVSFDAAAYLVLRGELPSEPERVVFSACLTAAIDHGPNAPSTDVARRVASNGTTINAAMAAGVAAIGDHHGGAIEQVGLLVHEACAQSGSIAQQAVWLVDTGIQRHRRVPGFGHRVYTESDPRVSALFAVAERAGVADRERALLLAAHSVLQDRVRKPLPINIDGAMAAVLIGLGFPWKLLRGVFIVARSPGLLAHIAEQRDREPPVLRSETPLEYDGPRQRTLPGADRDL